MSASAMKTAQDVQTIVDRSPYLTWLGLRVLAVGPDTLSATATWRPEWVANVEIGQTQGGILAALLDFAAAFATVGTVGRAMATVDLRIDYHRMARKGDLRVEGHAVRVGGTLTACDARVLDEGGKLVAAARGTFMSVRTEPKG